MKKQTKGFALPTVMIASVIMLMVLLSGLVAASSVSVSLGDQYYDKIAKEASESGVAMAKMCLEQNNYKHSWSLYYPLQSFTDCNGVPLRINKTAGNPLGVPIDCANVHKDRSECGVINNSKIQTTFQVKLPEIATGDVSQKIEITAEVRLKLASGDVVRTVKDSSVISVARVADPEGTRASKRFWYLGTGAVLDFKASGTANPTASTALCAPSPVSCTAVEGVTVASDRNGEFLFWTNGINVWDKTGAVMADTTPGTPLAGSNSTTQASLIFPLDSTQKKYVVVTNNAVANGTAPDGGAGKLHFSVIDMSANSGNGQIVQKNTPVWATPPGNANYSGESAAAAPKADGSGFWILSPDPDTSAMRVFEIKNYNSVTGDPKSNTNPVSTTAAGVAVVSSRPNSNEGIGFSTLNFNDDYSRMVLMQGSRCVGISQASCQGNHQGAVRVMGFNTATGAIINQLSWNNATTNRKTGTSNTGYSADFSPKGKYVYTTRIYGGAVHRYLIEGKANGDTVGGVQFIGYSSPPEGAEQAYQGGGQIKRAPNGKMYVANRDSQSISVVNSPDELLASIGWSYNTVGLNGRMSYYGLPETSILYSRRTTLF